MRGKKKPALKAVALILSLYLGIWVLLGFLGLGGSKASASSILLEEILDGLIIAIVLGTVKRSYLITLSEMGITYPKSRLSLLSGLMMGGVLWLVGGAASDAMKQIVPGWATVPAEYDFVATYASSHGFSKAVLFLAFVLATPTIEEVLFRGLIHSVLRRGFSPLGTLVLSSGIFGLWHVYPSSVVATFLIGCVLAWLREYGRSLLGPIVAHMTINSLSLIFSELK